MRKFRDLFNCDIQLLRKRAPARGIITECLFCTLGPYLQRTAIIPMPGSIQAKLFPLGLGRCNKPQYDAGLEEDLPQEKGASEYQGRVVETLSLK